MTARRPYIEKPPKRVSRRVETKKARPIDLARMRVLRLGTLGPVTVMTLAVDASDLILIGVGIRDWLGETDLPRPLVEVDGSPALVVRHDGKIPGLIVGGLVSAQIRFETDAAFEIPAIAAVADRVHVHRRQIWEKAPITLPEIQSRTITDSDIGLKPSEGAQLRAEDQIRLAAAARMKADAQVQSLAEAMRSAIRLDTPAKDQAESDLDAQLDAVEDQRFSSDDAAILAELKRLEQMSLPRWMRGP